VIKAPAGRLSAARIRTATPLEGIADAAPELAGPETEWDASGPSILPGDASTSEQARDRLLVGELQLAGVSAQTALRWPLKLLRTPGRGTELFDLAEDPGQLRDLANADEEARVALEAALDARPAAARSGLELSCVGGGEVKQSAGAARIRRGARTRRAGRRARG